MSALRSVGVDVLVSMLTTAEEDELDLTNERFAAEAAALRFLTLPTPDFGISDRASFLASVASWLATWPPDEML